MRTVICIPGLGDEGGYITPLTKKWRQRHGLQVDIFPFGWEDPLESYEQKYKALEERLRAADKPAVIGISAGGSVALNMLRRHPELVSCAINICGPLRLREQDQMLKRLVRHPLLRQSIEELQQGEVLATRVMTFRPLYDHIVATVNVPLEGADNRRLGMVGHATGIIWTLLFHSREIADFIRRH